jgi:hypothetical protein
VIVCDRTADESKLSAVIAPDESTRPMYWQQQEDETMSSVASDRGEYPEQRQNGIG